MLADRQSLVDSEALQARQTNASWVAVDNLDLSAHLNSSSNVTCQSSSDSLGAIIDTSGTTGNPKGVMIEQHSMVDLVVHAN